MGHEARLVLILTRRMIMDNKTIYNLKLHEQIRVAKELWYRRVPGGWLVADYAHFDDIPPVFVPFHNEFNG